MFEIGQRVARQVDEVAGEVKPDELAQPVAIVDVTAHHAIDHERAPAQRFAGLDEHGARRNRQYVAYRRLDLGPLVRIQRCPAAALQKLVGNHSPAQRSPWPAAYPRRCLVPML